MIPETTMQLTLYVLQTLGEVPLYMAELHREESIYSEQLNELYSRIRVQDLNPAVMRLFNSRLSTETVTSF